MRTVLPALNAKDGSTSPAAAWVVIFVASSFSPRKSAEQARPGQNERTRLVVLWQSVDLEHAALLRFPQSRPRGQPLIRDDADDREAPSARALSAAVV